MAKELKSVDVSQVPELLSLAEEVRATGEPCVLIRQDEELAILTPVKSGKRARGKTGIVTRTDPLWNIVGIGRSQGPGDISENKHKYLAEAYATKHR